MIGLSLRQIWSGVSFLGAAIWIRRLRCSRVTLVNAFLYDRHGSVNGREYCRIKVLGIAPLVDAKQPASIVRWHRRDNKLLATIGGRIPGPLYDRAGELRIIILMLHTSKYRVRPDRAGLDLSRLIPAWENWDRAPPALIA